VAWTAGGDGLVTQFRVDRSNLVRVDLDAVTRLHSVVNGWMSNLRPSPDGQRLFYGQGSATSTPWLVEQMDRVPSTPAPPADARRGRARR
jgi:hypothetical protein